MQTLVTVIHVITCIFLVILVLIQSGKGAEISASLGGSSQTIFGSSGGANFFTRLTGALAAIFMVTSVVLTVLSGGSKRSLFEGMPAANPPVAAPSGMVPPPATGTATGTTGAPATPDPTKK